MLTPALQLARKDIHISVERILETLGTIREVQVLLSSGRGRRRVRPTHSKLEPLAEQIFKALTQGGCFPERTGSVGVISWVCVDQLRSPQGSKRTGRTRDSTTITVARHIISRRDVLGRDPAATRIWSISFSFVRSKLSKTGFDISLQNSIHAALDELVLERRNSNRPGTPPSLGMCTCWIG